MSQVHPGGSRAHDVAVIGLGAIGLPVSINLVRSGFRVQAWNRSPAPTQAAADAGVMLAKTPTAVDAPIVLVALPDLPELVAVLAAGLNDALRPGDVLVVMSTVAPSGVRSLAESMASAGVRVVDAPVSGGDVGAQEGTLSIMVGGDPADVSVVLPVLNAIGRRVEHLGPVGVGQVAKACNQIIVGATLAAIGEALALGRAHGLQFAQLLDVLSAGMAGSRAMDIKRMKYLTGDYRPGGAVAHQLKDLRIASVQAVDVGLDLPVTRAAEMQYRRLAEAGQAHLDHSAIALLYLP